MRDKAIGIGELVIDFVFEDKGILRHCKTGVEFRPHIPWCRAIAEWFCHTCLAAELLENREHTISEEQVFDGREVGDNVLGSHQLPFASLIHFIVGHPFAFLTRPGEDLANPFRRLAWVGYEAMLFAGNIEKSISLKVGEVLVSEDGLNCHVAFCKVCKRCMQHKSEILSL